MIDVVEEVAEGRARVSWGTVRSQRKGKTLVIYVFQDAMKFDNVPALRWNFQPVDKTDPWYTDEVFNGVRLPASALQLQTIADLTGCLLLTPKVIDLLWLQAELRFDPVLNTPRAPKDHITRTIVATSHIHVVHRAIEEQIKAKGGDQGQLIACVGKYWCLINRLANTSGLLYGADNACNYGWPSSDGRYAGVTPGIKCWQGPGFKHDHNHWDPSQTIRLMYRKAVLIHEDQHEEVVDLRNIASDPELAGLLHHDPGKLLYLRQRGVPMPADSVARAMYAPKLSI